MWLLVPILLYSLLYLYVRHVYSHWRRKGFPTERTGLNWRFLKQVYRREFHHVSAVNEAYAAGRAQFLGIYFFFRPTLLVRDMTLARTILEHSFVHFNDARWDQVRGYRKVNLLEKLAPIFAKGRVDGMLRNVEKVADHMVGHLRRIATTAELAPVVDMQQTIQTYAINIIGNLIYGLDSNSFEQADCSFTNYISRFCRSRGVHSFTLNRLPKKSSLTYRLRDIIKESVEKRETGGYIRKDILQLLVKFRNGNEIADGPKQSWHIENVFEREKVLSIKKLSKIAESFLNMSLETIASTIVLTLYEVLRDPAIHALVLAELGTVERPPEAGQQVTNAELETLKYLDACIKETLRKYPGVPIIERVCRKNFIIPDTRFVISEGKTVMIPLMAMQRDEKYFVEPLKFKPERFLLKETPKNGESHMDYGLGAGTCVAQNFSRIVIKMAVVKLLLNFRMELAAEGQRLEVVHKPTPTIKCREGLRVKLRSQIESIKPNINL